MTRPEPARPTGTLFIVATPIGHLDDISVRALAVLKSVAIVAAEDTRRSGNLLRHFHIQTPLISLHEHNEHARVPAVLGRLLAGESVALVTDAGTPGISDPGSEVIAAARAAGVRVEPIPGPSAVITALSAAGVGSEGFSFHGFPPVRSKDRNKWFLEIIKTSERRPVVFFEAPHRLLSTLGSLDSIKRPICVCRELTKIHEEVVWGTPDDLVRRFAEPRGEFTLVIPALDPASVPRPVPMDDEIALVFGQITESTAAGSKRDAARQVAERLSLTTGAVYDALERVKLVK